MYVPKRTQTCTHMYAYKYMYLLVVDSNESDKCSSHQCFRCILASLLGWGAGRGACRRKRIFFLRESGRTSLCFARASGSLVPEECKNMFPPRERRTESSGTQRSPPPCTRRGEQVFLVQEGVDLHPGCERTGVEEH